MEEGAIGHGEAGQRDPQGQGRQATLEGKAAHMKNSAQSFLSCAWDELERGWLRRLNSLSSSMA